MKTIHTRHLLPLAAIALIAAACDPFPAKPGGDPRIVRLITTDQVWTSHSVTVENTGAAGTISTDKAYPLDQIFIQFNKPMDGLTLQKYGNYDAAGTKIDPTTLPAADQATGVCTKPDNLTSTFPANTTFCYVPSAVGDGGQLVVSAVTDADDNRGAWIVAGTNYVISGTVKDYQGKSLAINVTVSLDTVPFTSTGDTLAAPALGRTYAYGFRANWFPVGGVGAAGGYDVSYAKDAGSGTPPAEADAAWITSTVAASACAAASYPGVALGSVVCSKSFGELDPKTDYWFRWRVTGTTAWTVSEAPQTTRAAMALTLTNYSDPLVVPAVVSHNAVNLAWGRYLGTAVPNSDPGVFPPPASALPPPDPAFTADELAAYNDDGPLDDRTVVVVERFTDDGTKTEPDPAAAGWSDISSTLVRIDDVLTDNYYTTTYPGVTFPTHFAYLSRTAVDLTAVSGTGYWYRVRPNYVSAKVLKGTAAYKLTF